MALNHIEPETSSDSDESTIYTGITTPSGTFATGLMDDDDESGFGSADPCHFLVPWPSSTFMIRSVLSGQMLTLLDGQVVLRQPGDRGSMYWVCVESKGWLGFRNTVSGKFLGYDAKGNLCCSAAKQKEWEQFCVRMRPEGGCVLLMTNYDRLWHVGIKAEQGVEKLAKIGDGASDGVVWEFTKV